MKIFILFFFFSITGLAADELNIHLLTSLNDRKGKIEEIVYKRLKKSLKNIPHTITFINQANQEDLYNSLTDQKVDALFWVSHSGFKSLGKNETTGLGAQNVIIDASGDNIAPLFQLIGKNLKFLAIIGCNTEKILDSYEELGHLTQKNENLISYISNKKEVAQFAIKRAAKKLKKNFLSQALAPSSQVSEMTTNDSLELSIERTLPASPKSIRIMSKGKILGLIPQNATSYQLRLPKSETRYHLEFFAGENIYTNATASSLGELFLHSDHSDWKLFSKRNGDAFGANSLLFIQIPKK